MTTYFVEVDGDARGPFGLTAPRIITEAFKLRLQYRETPGTEVMVSRAGAVYPVLSWLNEGDGEWRRSEAKEVPMDLLEALAGVRPSVAPKGPYCACGRKARRWRHGEPHCTSCYRKSLPSSAKPGRSGL